VRTEMSLAGEKKAANSVEFGLRTGSGRHVSGGRTSNGKSRAAAIRIELVLEASAGLCCLVVSTLACGARGPGIESRCCC